MNNKKELMTASWGIRSYWLEQDTINGIIFFK